MLRDDGYRFNLGLALKQACVRGRLSIAKEILSREDLNMSDGDGHLLNAIDYGVSCLHVCAIKRRPKIAKRLLQDPRLVLRTDQHRVIFLYILEKCIAENWVEIAHLLLKVLRGTGDNKDSFWSIGIRNALSRACVGNKKNMQDALWSDARVRAVFAPGSYLEKYPALDIHSIGSNLHDIKLRWKVAVKKQVMVFCQFIRQNEVFQKQLCPDMVMNIALFLFDKEDFGEEEMMQAVQGRGGREREGRKRKRKRNTDI